MNVEMSPVEIIGLKSDLKAILHALRQAGCVHIDEITEAPEVSARPLALDRETLHLQEELGLLTARIEGLLDALGYHEAESLSTNEGEVLEAARAGIEELFPQVQSLTARREKLEAEWASLPRYEATLQKLLPVIPPSARIPGNVTVGVLVSRLHVGVLDSIGKRVLDLTGGQAEMVASDVDSATRAMLVVFPQEFTQTIEELLGKEDVSRLRLPAELGEGPPDTILANLHRRMIEIPKEIEQIDRQLAELAKHWGERLMIWREVLREQRETFSVLSKFGETDMTFILMGWVPVHEMENLEIKLKNAVGEMVVLHRLPMTADLMKRAPILLKNPPPARPFESLVNMLALPRYAHLDPTALMAVFMPIFFGMILGDVGYGFLLLVLCLWLRRRFKPGRARDITTVLGMGSAWSILFGFLYGEAFGTLGEQFGMHPLWFDRASAEHVAGLLIMTLVIGAVHITLGLILGVIEAIQDKSKSHLLERGGMLVGLISLFFIVGILNRLLPPGFMTPAIVGLIIGIVLLSASLGWLGIIMGPIEFIGLIGNVLSYLRIAAIGLASVYLAKVANDVAGMIGNVIVGLIVALLIHALNLVLGAFSPTIHSLRLHYVEFFRKFYEGGGRPYQPFKSGLHSEDRLTRA